MYLKASVAALLCASSCALGCGGSDTPTSVSTADLQKTGAFWNKLNPDLKTELAGSCKDAELARLSEPEAQGAVQRMEIPQYVAKLNATLGEAPDEKIAVACQAATRDIAAEQLNQLMPELRDGQ